MSTLHNIISTFESELASVGSSEARLSVQWIVQEVLGFRRAEIILNRDKIIGTDELGRMQAMVNRRAQGEPIQYVVGHTDFMGFNVSVGPGVLIPRPETEELVALALDAIPVGVMARILDIGTGSGCISIAIARLRPNAQVTGIDISSEAIRYARHNAKKNGARVDFLCLDSTQDRFSTQLGLAEFDLVVSNPPYIGTGEKDDLQPEVRNFEPDVALFSGIDGTEMFTQSLSNIAAVLKVGGKAFFEIHSQRADAFAEILREARFQDVVLKRDVQGRLRILSGRKSSY